MKYHRLSSVLIILCLLLVIDQISSIDTPSPHLDVGSSGASSLKVPDIDSLFSNVTSLGAVDPAFGFVPVLGDVKLRPVPCLLNTVNAALQLALEDYEGFMSKTVYKLNSHPEVQIEVIPDGEGESIPRKYVVWGLSMGIALMMDKINFVNAVFILSYQGHGVACIKYDLPAASEPLPTDITNATQSLNLTLPLSETTKELLQTSTDANTTNVNTLNYPRLRVACQLTGSIITINKIFYLVLDMLRELAVCGRTAQFTDFTTYFEAANIVISTQHTNPPRTPHNPPYFQVEWLMRALAQTPTYMLEQRDFREVDMVLFVDEVEVGGIRLRVARRGTGPIPGSDDISTS